MAQVLASGGGCNLVDLVLATSKSILQISKILSGRQTEREVKKLLRHFIVHCTLVFDQVQRIRTNLVPENDLLLQALGLFESLIALDATSNHPYGRQQGLNKRWHVMRTQNSDAKFAFATHCLVLDQTSILHALDESFNVWEEDVMAKYPEDGLDWSLDDYSTGKEGRTEPSFAVHSAARSMFKALTRSTSCECCTKHDALLCLRTYSTLEVYQGDDNETNDFEMLLSSHHDWQEVHVRTIRKRALHFIVDNETQPSPPPKEELDYKPMPVKKLCDQLRKMQQMASKRLELKVENGRLFKLRSEKSKFRIDKRKAPISLQEFIRESPRSLTEKTKRILAVLLSYTVLHLHDTPWLQPSWNSSNILFFQTLSANIPLRPFIQTQLTVQDLNDQGQDEQKPQSNSGGVEFLGRDPDGIDPDDIFTDPDDNEHPFPTLVTLAIVLMELYLAAPFDILAKKCGLCFPEHVDRGSLDVASVITEYKREIPQNSQFHHVLEKCLDSRIWKDDNGRKLDDQALSVRIYGEVVRPLEDELCDAFDFIKIEELDATAENLDFRGWGQAIYQHEEDTSSRGTPVSLTEEIFPNQRRDWAKINHSISSHAPSPCLGSGHHLATGSEYVAAQFYDNEKPSDSHSRLEMDDYMQWRLKHQAVHRKFIDPFLKQLPGNPVKIAVLDSGVDDTHILLDTGQIQLKRNWTTAKKKDVTDHFGHGTFTASLLIDYAPDSQLFIAKVAEGAPSPPEVVAEAIMTAVDEWKVDIISISFGYPTNQMEGYEQLENAILYAYSKRVLLFAAASNSGANLDRAYPARDPHVICVHSTDSNGNRSRFSPTPLAQESNIATVGEAVESAWPVKLCNTETNSQCVQWKSGTSSATPILVGIAAFLLQYARIHLPDKAHMLRRQEKMKSVLLKISDKTQKSITRDGYNYIALNLFADNLFGKSKVFIDETIGDLLKR
uniref:Peptidase S8/S53 domain-containing protein n=1 Tax=Bionectria ochroleuca TaxID=29856 RepID=A0A8H7K8C9_BIOOC